MKHTITTLTALIFSMSLVAATAAKTGASKGEAPKTPSAKLELAKSKNKVEFLVTGDLGGISVPGHIAEDYKGTGPLVGELILEKGKLSGTATYELKALTTGIGMRDSHMKNKYLEVEKHPQAKLTIDPVTLPTTLTTAGANATETFPFAGKMEVKGQTKPIAGTVVAKRTGDEYDFKFKWDLKLTDFGIETPSFMEVTLTEKVSLDASIQGTFL